LYRKTLDILFDNKWSLPVVLAIWIIVAILIVFLAISLYNLEKFKPIANLDFEESEWIKINSANLQITSNDRIISPNDPVTLFLSITNKVPLKITIDPEFYPYVLGEIGDAKHVNSITYDSEHSGTFSRLYFPTTEGLNILKVSLKISYYNGTFLTYQNATTSFNVISHADELQIQQNSYFLIGVFASVGIGIGTITALVFSVKYSRKEVEKLTEQNKNLSEQFDIQNKPWILINELEPKFATYGTRDIPWEEYLKNLAKDPETEIPQHIKIRVSCTNVGKFPTKIIEYRHTGNNITTFEELKQNKHSERILFPNQSMSFVPTVLWDTDTDFFIAYLIEYTYSIFGKKETVFVGTQWKIRDKGIFDLDYWPKEL